MKNLSQIAWRFLKVIYALLLLFGLLPIIAAWNLNSPYSYHTYSSYKVVCNNGKEFDPTSKPIDRLNYSKPIEFDENQLKSECEYGTAYLVGSSANLPKNYELTYKTNAVNVGSKEEQLLVTIMVGVIYCLLLKIGRRIFLYIFFGKSFLPFSKSK